MANKDKNKDWTVDEDGVPQGVLAQHRKRTEEDEDYNKAVHSVHDEDRRVLEERDA